MKHKGHRPKRFPTDDPEDKEHGEPHCHNPDRESLAAAVHGVGYPVTTYALHGKRCSRMRNPLSRSV